jgi:hypothetical protein
MTGDQVVKPSPPPEESYHLSPRGTCVMDFEAWALLEKGDLMPSELLRVSIS